MLYLTYGDQPSGVYASQVVDVCRHLSALRGKPVPLVALVSLRGFKQTKAHLLQLYPHAIVLPSAPGLKRWRMNGWLLRRTVRKLGEKGILARGPLATHLALDLRKRGIIQNVAFDGRGAYHAEWNEYDVVPDPQLKGEILGLERDAVLRADGRLAVSAALVRHWQQKYGYGGSGHVVIPCTLNAGFQTPLPSAERRAQLRAARGYQPDDIVLVYSGSSAGWQSFGEVDALVTALMQQNAAVKILFLAKVEKEKLSCAQQFPDRVQTDWLGHDAVAEVLAACDYGILVREQTVTNQVASPTKFAEYLSRGLRVLISPNLGDYSAWVEEQQCGSVAYTGQIPPIQPVPDAEKQRLAALAQTVFAKSHYDAAYQSLLTLLDSTP